MADKLDVLLIYPRDPHRVYPANIPLGICYIADVLEHSGLRVKLLDQNVEQLDYKQVINTYRPSVIGISGITHSRFESFKLAKIAKSINRSIIVIYGGCHASMAAEDTLKNIEEIDIIVRGDGEWIMSDIMRQIKNNGLVNLNKIGGISYRKNGTICHNPMPNSHKNLDELSYKIRRFVDIKKYNYRLKYIDRLATIIISSRGCIYHCIFCSRPLISNNTYTTRSPTNICDEIEWIRETYGINNFFFCDDNISLYLPHINNLCDEILHRKLDIFWECKVRVDTINFNILKKMHLAGCTTIFPGIETVTSRLLKIIDKNIEIKQLEEVLDWTNKIDILVCPYFIIGLPTQTYKEALETFNFIYKHKRKSFYPIIAFCTRIYPGTKIEEFALQNGLLPKGFSWSSPYYCRENISLQEDPFTPILIQPQLGFPELRKLYHAFIMRSLFKPRFIWGKLRRINSKEQVKKYFRVINNWMKN